MYVCEVHDKVPDLSDGSSFLPTYALHLYRVAVTVEGPDASSLVQTLQFQVQHDRGLYLWVSALLRAILLLATIIGR